MYEDIFDEKLDSKTSIMLCREWNLVFHPMHYRGQIAFENNIKFVIHTRENGHNKPHLHAQYQDKEVVVEIPTGKILKGNIEKKHQKYASEWVINHEDFLKEKWNELTQGCFVPVL